MNVRFFLQVLASRVWRCFRRFTRLLWRSLWQLVVGLLRVLWTVALYIFPFALATGVSFFCFVEFYEIAPLLSVFCFAAALPLLRFLHRWNKWQAKLRRGRSSYIPRPQSPPVKPVMSTHQVDDILHSVVRELRR